MSAESPEIRLPESSRAELVAILVTTILMIGIGFAIPFIPDKDGTGSGGENSAWVGGLVVVSFSWILALGLKDYLRRCGRVLVVDEREVRVERFGQVLWRVPWDDYGGTLSAGSSRAVIYNRRGDPVGDVFRQEPVALATESSRQRLSLMKALRELKRRTPTDGIRDPEPAPRRPRIRTTYARCWLLIAVGAITLGCSLWLTYTMISALDDPASNTLLADWLASHIRASILGLLTGSVIGVAIASGAVLGLLGLKYPNVWDPRRSEPPTAGPTFTDFLLDRDGCEEPVDLVEGREYRYVHPTFIGPRIASNARLSIVTSTMAFSIGLIAAMGAIVDPKQRLAASLVALAMLGIGAFFLKPAAHFSRLSDRLDDLIEVQDEVLLVTHGGQTRSYPRSTRSIERLPGFGNEFFGAYERYGIRGDYTYLDRRYLWSPDDEPSPGKIGGALRP